MIHSGTGSWGTKKADYNSIKERAERRRKWEKQLLGRTLADVWPEIPPFDKEAYLDQKELEHQARLARRDRESGPTMDLSELLSSMNN